MPKKESTPEELDEKDWVKFQSQKKTGPAKPVDPELARQNAQNARETARAFLGTGVQGAVQNAAEADVVPARAVPGASAEAETVTCSRCPKPLGRQVLGVCTGGAWYCPACYVKHGRDRSTHPTACAVECPTCNRQSVDFTGKHRCPACHSRAAKPLRVA